MSEFSNNPPLPFEDGQTWPMEADAGLRRDQGRPTALVHILTPEFQDLNPQDFADIPEEVVARASADDLRPSLFWSYIRKGERKVSEVSTFSYRTPDEGYVSVALTPEEYDAASESVGKLAHRVFNKVLTQRDAALKKETGDDSARARSNEDIRTAMRGGMRAVMDQQASMERLLSEGILPKIELIEKFIEMTQGRNVNMARGTRETVNRRFEELRTTVFDDMLDAAALQRGWTEDMATRAKRIIQKRLYISGTVRERVANFQDMLALAQDYYGYKRALMLTKIHEAVSYKRDNPEVLADIIATDEQRLREKEVKQLQLEADE